MDARAVHVPTSDRCPTARHVMIIRTESGVRHIPRATVVTNIKHQSKYVVLNCVSRWKMWVYYDDTVFVRFRFECRDVLLPGRPMSCIEVISHKPVASGSIVYIRRFSQWSCHITGSMCYVDVLIVQRTTTQQKLFDKTVSIRPRSSSA
jgi:hypothetical protein